MVCAKYFISAGAIIIDDIILPDGRAEMARLGGGSVHACEGMRVWSDCVGLAAYAGQDFPTDLLTELALRFDVQGVVRVADRTVRAWQLFESDGTRNEVFRTGFNIYPGLAPMVTQLPPAYQQPQGVHLHCSIEEAPAWIEMLQAQNNPLLLWEPPSGYGAPQYREAMRSINRRSDVVSPNLAEAQALTGMQGAEQAALALLEDGFALAVIRMGPQGSLLVTQQRLALRIPAAAVERIVDVTGAGNAYCGGLLVGLTCGLNGDRDDLKDGIKSRSFITDPQALITAGAMAAVSASFSLEQFGALYPLNGVRERAQERYQRLLSDIHEPYLL